MTTIADLRQQIAEARDNVGGGNKIVTSESGNEYEIRALSPWMSIKFGVKFGAANIMVGKPIDSLGEDLIEQYLVQTLLAGMINPAFATKTEAREFMEMLPLDAMLLFQEISLLSQAGGDINLSGFRQEQGGGWD